MSTNTWIQFARDLVTTGELDPVYNLIYGGKQRYGDQWAAQFALHFFMYYDVGQAAALANAQTELDFWHMQNFGYDAFKRGSERRHFRGEKGKQAMLNLQHIGSPEQIWKRMHGLHYHSLRLNVQDKFQGCQIGDYFTWKAMDILDRCLGMPVQLSVNEAAQYLPDTPVKAIRTFWRITPICEALDQVVTVINDLPAPGAPTRNCSYSEAETILCAMYGFNKGTYKFGSDIVKRREQLKDHPYLLDLLPEVPTGYRYDSTQALDTTALPA